MGKSLAAVAMAMALVAGGRAQAGEHLVTSGAARTRLAEAESARSSDLALVEVAVPRLEVDRRRRARPFQGAPLQRRRRWRDRVQCGSRAALPRARPPTLRHQREQHGQPRRGARQQRGELCHPLSPPRAAQGAQGDVHPIHPPARAQRLSQLADMLALPRTLGPGADLQDGIPDGRGRG